MHPGSIDVVPPSFLPDGEFIVFVGALGEHKGVQVLLDAYRRLRDIRTRTGRATPTLLLVGPRHDAMPAVDAAKADVDDEQCIVVRHDVDHDEVLRTMARATALVVPSLWPEPFGLVAAEALTVGTPVIASAIGGLRALLSDGEYGLLVTPGDVEQLVAALDRILDDPQLRHELGTKGRARAQELDATAAFELCYDELLTGTGGGHSAPPTG